MDESTRRRWAGQEIDLRQPLPSDLILAAAEKDRSLLGATFGYMTMSALPASLREVEPRARAIYATGWRPPFAPGPTRDELACLISRALRTAPEPAAV